MHLDAWMASVDTDGLTALHGFGHGLHLDLSAVTAGLTLPFGHGPIVGAKRKVKLLAGFARRDHASCSPSRSRRPLHVQVRPTGAGRSGSPSRSDVSGGAHHSVSSGVRYGKQYRPPSAYPLVPPPRRSASAVAAR